MTDIVDEIDALIESQLDAGEPVGGYDYDDPDFPKCGHCARDWHGLPITERMDEMRWRGELDPDYRYVADTSRVVCPGSEFIGPLPAATTGARSDRTIDAIQSALGGGLWQLPDDPLGGLSDWLRPHSSATILANTPARWWRLDITAHRHLQAIDITFEAEGVGAVRSVVGPPARESLVMTIIDRSGSRQTGITALEDDPANGNYSSHRTFVPMQHALTTLDIHTARPHDLGGLIVWHEIDRPGGDYVRSRAVVSTGSIDRWFDDRGLWFLAPREARAAWWSWWSILDLGQRLSSFPVRWVLGAR
ncbi:hypothetical protein SEA_BRADISSA_70 [Gordonia phage Bradissa]|nr:hypothetical protein SEA_BRADISSA_70 [Gordonia phage Bradissa]